MRRKKPPGVAYLLYRGSHDDTVAIVPSRRHPRVIDPFRSPVISPQTCQRLKAHLEKRADNKVEQPVPIIPGDELDCDEGLLLSDWEDPLIWPDLAQLS
jgi:hypothetical protein